MTEVSPVSLVSKEFKALLEMMASEETRVNQVHLDP